MKGALVGKQKSNLLLTDYLFCMIGSPGYSPRQSADIKRYTVLQPCLVRSYAENIILLQTIRVKDI